MVLLACMFCAIYHVGQYNINVKCCPLTTASPMIIVSTTEEANFWCLGGDIGVIDVKEFANEEGFSNVDDVKWRFEFQWARNGQLAEDGDLRQTEIRKIDCFGRNSHIPDKCVPICCPPTYPKSLKCSI